MRQLVIFSKEHRDELLDEIRHLGVTVLKSNDTSAWIKEDNVELAWAGSVWRDVKTIEFESITDAQKKLKAISRQWNYYGDLLFRRGALIAEGLTPKKQAAIAFPSLIENRGLPAFTMADQGLIYYSQKVCRPTVDGKISFLENKTLPPSRAYLKLWEALTILGDWPKKGESVVDLGSCPGSWSWAMAELGAEVTSIDRSPLDEKISKYKNIHFQSGDAFGFKPRKMDWVFSDVICFPEKLHEFMKNWVDSGQCKKFVCTLKFTGKPDPAVIDLFRKLPNSRVIHLFNNKNELTWMKHPSIA